MYDVNLAASDISKLLNSLYAFSQNGIQIMLSSPILTMLPIVNPIAMIVSAIIAADPVKMVTDYPAWQSEFSSRQAAVSNNYNSVYTFVSTGIPQAESMLLSIMSQISNLADHLTMHIGPESSISQALKNQSFGRQITAALAGIGGVSELPGLDAENNEMHAALQSAAYYHLHPGMVTAQPNHATDDVYNIPTPTLAPATSEA
ncbi:hypothetical protein GGI22_002183 [Coemansia erecta]|nr:hypothetical protein GGI22_002183 [Coemansia erecta]